MNSATRKRYDQLRKRLMPLLPAQFEALVYCLGLPAEKLHSAVEPQTVRGEALVRQLRALELIDEAEEILRSVLFARSRGSAVPLRVSLFETLTALDPEAFDRVIQALSLPPGVVHSYG